MFNRHFRKNLIGFVLGVSAFIFAGANGVNAYAADSSDITVTSTKEEVQQVVDEGNFNYRELDEAEIEHVYNLYNNDPETIKQLQRQSDYASSQETASLASSGYTHSSMFKNHKVVKGIDVSEWNGDDINWKKVKASGISFAFIRVGGRYYGSGAYYRDSTFEQNIKAATAAGIDVGVYFYSQAINTAEAKREAAYTMNLLSGYNINLPIVMDYEYAWEGGLTGRLYNAHLSKSTATNVIKTFCSTVEAKGYVGMLYASKTVITDDMNAASIASLYPVWTAQYNDTDTLTTAHSYWQYSDAGVISGINNHLTDLNFRYIKAPKAPSSLSVRESTDSTITLSWTKVPEVYGYQILRLDESTGAYTSVGTVKGASKLTFTDKNLQDGKKYTYRVRGYYKLNSGTVYGVKSTETAGITVPDNVENFAAKAVSSSSIKLSWTPIPVTSGYRIYRYNSTKKAYEAIYTSSSSATSSYIDTDLAGGTEYSYKIRAFTKTSTDTIWHVVSGAISMTTLPGQVSGLKASYASSNSITLKWNKENNVAGYIIYQWDSKTATWSKIGKTYSASSAIFTQTGLPAATQYSYTVAAYYKHNGKYFNTPLAPSVTASTGPDKPANVITLARTSNSIRIMWSKTANTTGYIVYLYNTKTKTYDSISTIQGADDRTYTISELSSSTVYKIGIKAFSQKNGYTSYSNIREYSSCTVPPMFSGSFKMANLSSKAYLQWRKLSGVNGYVIYKYNDSTKKYTMVKILPAETTSYIAPALSKGNTYRIRAYKTFNGKYYYGEMSSDPIALTSLNGVVTDYQVRVRSGAGTNHSIITELGYGTKIQIIGSATASDKSVWYKITFTKNGKKITGYMMSDFIRIN